MRRAVLASLSRLLKKAHLLRCARSPRFNVSVNTFVDLSRASHLGLFEQPGIRVFQHPVRSPVCEAERCELIRRAGPMIRRLSKFVHGTFVLLYASAAFGARAGAWKGDWKKTLQAAKKEGRLVLYDSPDFELCEN